MRINFVNDDEFERLPGTDMASKVGVAYPKYGEAYVRKSGVRAVDVFSAMHELEHLEGSDRGERYDAENECYYKGFGDIFNTVAQAASFIPSPVQPFAATYSAANGIKQAATGSNFFGGGEQSGNQEQAEPQMQSLQAPQIAQPFTSSVSGMGSGQGAGMGQASSATGGVKALNQQPQFGDIESQRYGNISGRSPLMNVFGGRV